MTLFELTFALSAVILGLALTQIVSSLHRVMLAGRRVHWAPEPILLCTLIFLVTVAVWLQHWNYRHQTATTIGLVMLLVLPLLLLFLAAAFVLPEHVLPEGRVDLLPLQPHARLLLWRAAPESASLSGLRCPVRHASKRVFRLVAADRSRSVAEAAFGVLISIRSRWFNILILTLLAGTFAYKFIPIPLTQ